MSNTSTQEFIDAIQREMDTPQPTQARECKVAEILGAIPSPSKQRPPDVSRPWHNLVLNGIRQRGKDLCYDVCVFKNTLAHNGYAPPDIYDLAKVFVAKYARPGPESAPAPQDDVEIVAVYTSSETRTLAAARQAWEAAGKARDDAFIASGDARAHLEHRAKGKEETQRALQMAKRDLDAKRAGLLLAQAAVDEADSAVAKATETNTKTERSFARAARARAAADSLFEQADATLSAAKRHLDATQRTYDEIGPAAAKRLKRGT